MNIVTEVIYRAEIEDDDSSNCLSHPFSHNLYTRVQVCNSVQTKIIIEKIKRKIQIKILQLSIEEHLRKKKRKTKNKTDSLSFIVNQPQAQQQQQKNSNNNSFKKISQTKQKPLTSNIE